MVEHACVCVNQNELMKNLLLWSSFKPTTEPTTHPGPPSHLPPLWNLHLQDQLLEALLLSLLWMIVQRLSARNCHANQNVGEGRPLVGLGHPWKGVQVELDITLTECMQPT